MAQESNNYLEESIGYDLQEIMEMDVTSDDFKVFLEKLTDVLGNILTTLNTKDTAYYTLFEIMNNHQFFNPPTTDAAIQPIRNGFRVAINFGALPNAGLKTVAHNVENIGSTYTLTRIYAGATDVSTPPTVLMIPIPYVDVTAANANIQLYADETNVYIDTDTVDRTNFTRCIVVMEYLKY